MGNPICTLFLFPARTAGCEDETSRGAENSWAARLSGDAVEHPSARAQTPRHTEKKPSNLVPIEIGASMIVQ
jgi:hypothetical protein